MKQNAIIYDRQACIKNNAAPCTNNIETCKALADKHHLKVIRVFQDKGVSGSTAERPEFTSMLEYIAAQDAPVTILTSGKSTIARNIEMFQQRMNELSDMGAKIITPYQTFPSPQNTAH